jgi:hypothetical protein
MECVYCAVQTESLNTNQKHTSKHENKINLILIVEYNIYKVQPTYQPRRTTQFSIKFGMHSQQYNHL